MQKKRNLKLLYIAEYLNVNEVASSILSRKKITQGRNERPVLNKTILLATMVVLSSLQTNLHFTTTTTTTAAACPNHTCKAVSPSLLYLRHLYGIPTRPRAPNGNGVLLVKAYMEESNTLSGFANKVIGSLPVIGLVARILSDEGGVGGDIIDFAEFRRRVGNKCSINDSRAFYEFRERRGRSGDPLYVLLCCWLAAVGAGLLKSEEILEGVARLRISNDIEFEEETFIAMMNEAREKRAKLRASAPAIPMEIRAEKALEAIYVCCFGGDPIEEEDARLLPIMLNAVFPSIGQPGIEKIVNDKIKRVAEGSEEIKFPTPKPLSKEAVQMQMKDLQFLKQINETQ